MKITQHGYLIAKRAAGGSSRFFWSPDKIEYHDTLVVKEHTFEIEIPADFDFYTEKAKRLTPSDWEYWMQAKKEG